jgi:ATP-binding cassette subfamily F protein 3
MIDSANESNRSKVRDMLGSFLFRGEEVDKKVKVLSGGERNRLALCKLLLQPFNVLVMDEPTNHLDIKSKNVLKEALNRFEGTLIIVSHDRDFLQGLTNKVYEFRNKKIKEYLGDIDFYLDQRKMEDMRAVEKKTEVEKVKEDKSVSQGQLSYEQQKELKSLNNKLSNTESKISKLEKEIKEEDVALATNYEETMAQKNFFENYSRKKKELEKLMLRWEEIQEKLEAFN